VRASCLAALSLGLLVTACAGYRPSAADAAGPALTIRNEGHRLLDISYRCVQNGAVYRLDAIEPQTVRTFRIRPAWCANLHVLSHTLAARSPDVPAYAVVPLHGDRENELVFTQFGVLINRTGAASN